MAYYIYIATNIHNTVLYTGVTNDLIRRVFEHKQQTPRAFTTKYRVTKLVYYEECDNPESAISREKQIKAGSRYKKLSLIRLKNPNLRDLYKEIIG
ncbi:GIY-YIG nuclease family protein [Patescibacteria group bacterium]|nr:GIY-YIG nuclease family protein [Patescibacteria group bacterium]